MALVQSDPNTVPRGASAPDFSLPNTVDNQTVNLADFKEKPVVVLFMCNHCPYVIPKMEEIANLQNDFEDVAILCISSNDKNYVEEDGPEFMKEVAEKHGYKYYLYDESQDVARAYGATCTPDPYVFDKDHKLVYHGRINDDVGQSNNPSEHTMREVLTKLANGEEIEEWFLPSVGCSIKWK